MTQSKPITDFTATASILGFHYQTQCALLLLLRAEEETERISIERFDDILLESETGTSTTAQTKHHIKPGSLTDYSTDLWRTLRVWSETAIKSPETLESFKRLIITTALAPPNSAASKLRQNAATRDLRGALEDLLRVANTSENESHKEYYQKFLELGRERQMELLRSIYVIDRAPNIVEVEKEILKIISYTILPRNLSKFYERLLGWWTRKIQQHLIGYSVKGISNEELRKTIDELQQQQFPDNLTIDYRDLRTPETEEGLAESERMFVKQLYLIDVRHSQMISQAIGDYYRASNQRFRWIREKALIDKELEDYEEKLVGEWRVQSALTNMDLNSGSSEDDKISKGQLLLKWVYGDALYREDLRIRPKTTEPYVLRGSYHMLANDLRVGWHIDFENRLKQSVSQVKVQK